jgi:diaminohydroxyphosphoribosylaminopyrimidine deaminase / 5-amino-6-(5-phosphoribosylamino)uracil reductase
VHDDTAFMRRALQLAHLGLGATHPNPMVGAVVVRDGRVVGEGFHARHGGAHGEIVALASAGEAARGATLYVTLEPCAHHGRTPPCTDAILAAGIVRVVYAAEDPNPEAAGGAEILRKAGIQVEGGVERAQARSANAVFFHTHEHATPFVAVKLALSLDGAVAGATGTRTPITGGEAQQRTHRLRAAHDAVMIGSRTAAIDDPLLTVRCADAGRQPLRIVLDSNASLALDSQLAATLSHAPVTVICGDHVAASRLEALHQAGIHTIAVKRSSEGIDLGAAFDALTTAGVRSILVEGGPRLVEALLAQERVSRMYIFMAPRVLGGGAVPAFTNPGLLDDWRCIAAEPLGRDALLIFDPVGRA